MKHTSHSIRYTTKDINYYNGIKNKSLNERIVVAQLCLHISSFHYRLTLTALFSICHYTPIEVRKALELLKHPCNAEKVRTNVRDLLNELEEQYSLR